MTEKIIEAGTTQTAPVSAPAEAQGSKLMVLAIHRGHDDEIVITPIDVEHTTDDLTMMTDSEQQAKKLLDGVFISKQSEMMEALTALYQIYEHRLYRNQFRTFENFCFAMYGTNRLNDVLMKMVRQRAKALEAEVKEES